MQVGVFEKIGIAAICLAYCIWQSSYFQIGTILMLLQKLIEKVV